MPRLLSQPHGDSLGDLLNRRLREPQWTTFRSAVAFVKRSGVIHIADGLRAFARHGRVRMTVGVSMGGTSIEGLESLLDCIGGRGEVWVFHNENGPTFHPKMYVFSNERNSEVIIGSGNLTQGGLFANYESSIELSLDLANPEDHALSIKVESILNEYTDGNSGTAVPLSYESLERLHAAGYVVPEAQMHPPKRKAQTTETIDSAVPPVADQLFRHVAVPLPPPIPTDVHGVTPKLPDETPSAFYMTLQRTDAGTGQTTPGTARRSPEIFIPLAARNAAPGFWQWPHAFRKDPESPGKLDRTGVPMVIGDTVVRVNMTYFPHRHEFRLRNELLRSAGGIGDILRIERTDAPEHDYSVTVIQQDTPDFERAFERCNKAVTNSPKRWGYE